MTPPADPPPPDLPALLDALAASGDGVRELAAHLRADRPAEAWARFVALVPAGPARARLLETLRDLRRDLWVTALVAAFRASEDPAGVADLARVAALTGYRAQTIKDLRKNPLYKVKELGAFQAPKRGPKPNPDAARSRHKKTPAK
jgi:hypothetical protein